jgi:hypothetical protein
MLGVIPESVRIDIMFIEDLEAAVTDLSIFQQCHKRNDSSEDADIMYWLHGD